MNYWIFKFKKEQWEDWDKQEIGSVFTASVKHHRKMMNPIGDIVLWYEKGKIYLVSEVISDIEEDPRYQGGHVVRMLVLQTLYEKSFSLDEKGFEELNKDVKKGQQGAINYRIEPKSTAEKLYGEFKIIQKEKLEKEKLSEDDYRRIKDLKNEAINDGYMFNPFLDTNLIRHEVKHVSFIANLLNPHGTHMQGDIFLKAFLKEIDEKNLDNFNTYSAQVYTEVSIGSNGANKGRIDLWIENNERVVAIEAKVETKDHDEQLIKYDKFLKTYSKENHKDYHLYYLTKTGEKPIGTIPEGLNCIGYNNEILSWMEKITVSEMPKRLQDILIDYKNSLECYLYEVSPIWKYELSVLKEMAQSKEAYQKYEQIKNNYYYDPQEYKYKEVEDIASFFKKINAYIEAEFFILLHKALKNDSISSNIIDIGENFSNPIIQMKLIDTIHSIRINRFSYTVNENYHTESFYGFEKGDKGVYIVWNIDEILLEVWKNDELLQNESVTIYSFKNQDDNIELFERDKLKNVVEAATLAMNEKISSFLKEN
jgi:hypothetical protein